MVDSDTNGGQITTSTESTDPIFAVRVRAKVTPSEIEVFIFQLPAITGLRKVQGPQFRSNRSSHRGCHIAAALTIFADRIIVNLSGCR